MDCLNTSTLFYNELPTIVKQTLGDNMLYCKHVSIDNN